jgi:hypothetical protein
VTPRRLRTGEWLAAVGAVALVVALSLDWFEEQPPRDGRNLAAPVLAAGDPSATGWASLGWPVVLLLVVAIALAAWLVVSTAGDASVGQPVMAAVLLSAWAPLALLVVLVRVTVAQPGLGAGLPDAAVAVRPAAYAGLAALALVVAGAWRSIADERTGAPESAYVPPPARPAPPERI